MKFSDGITWQRWEGFSTTGSNIVLKKASNFSLFLHSKTPSCFKWCFNSSSPPWIAMSTRCLMSGSVLIQIQFYARLCQRILKNSGSTPIGMLYFLTSCVRSPTKDISKGSRAANLSSPSWEAISINSLVAIW